jgi:glyoxylase-like metal-dependent hydrolase (beta-lactamase superfamily II)
VRAIESREEVPPGMVAEQVGGHSSGQLLTIVKGESGPVLIASDAVHFYEEQERDRPFAVFAALGAIYAGYDRMAELAQMPGCAVLAGHDPSVMERFPPLEGMAGLAVRVG